MDNLTHGLVGLAIGALRRPRGDAARGRRLSATDRAVLLASVVAAELPDLDNLLPAGNEVLHAVQAHRGLSHSLVFSPVWAAVAAAVAVAIFRGARPLAPFLHAWAAVVFGHILADLWTGWGTQILQPFSDRHFSLDWMMVVDPLFTVPLLIAAIVALVWRRRFRTALIAGLLVSGAYLVTRIALKEYLETKVAAVYPKAQDVNVFPDWMGLVRWRYVITQEDAWTAGGIRVGGEPRELATHPRPSLPEALAGAPTVREALQWARFPVASAEPTPEGGVIVSIGDLRYHLGGEPTLRLRIALGPQRQVQSAQLVRPPDMRALLRQWWEQR